MNIIIIFFIESKHLLCNFHREQSWIRWLIKISNGLSDNKIELKLLRNIAKSLTIEIYLNEKKRMISYMDRK